MGKKLEMAIGALNGAVGDWLERTGNGLATPMAIIQDGAAVAIEPAALARAFPAAAPRIAVLVHGLMATESVWDMPARPGNPTASREDYGARLAADVGLTPLYLRFNSGLAIPDNGVALARLLEAVVPAWPVPIEEIVLVGYSMGGLVARSACHAATELGHGWLPRVRRAIYVGTPHRGAPLERWGRALARVLRAVDDPYTRLTAQLADLRSDGIKDLGDADLRHADRARRVHAVALRDPRHPVPLLPTIAHTLIAGTIAADPVLGPLLTSLFGDALVPVISATDGAAHARSDAALLPARIKLLPGLAHVTLAHHPAVYPHIRAACLEPL